MKNGTNINSGCINTRKHATLELKLRKKKVKIKIKNKIVLT
jgi:hypothetical protein